MTVLTQRLQLAERIQLALDLKGISWSKAATNVGLTAQAATKWKKGQIGRETLQNLATLLNVDYGWLATGNGGTTERVTTSEEMLAYNKHELEQLIKNLPSAITHDQIPPDRASVAIPIYDVQFCCGDGVCKPEFIALKKHLPFDKSFFIKRNLNPDNFKLISATGNSMANYINKGDAVGIDISDVTPKDEQVYALCLDGDLMIKRIFKEGDGALRLSSDNKNYPDKMVNINDQDLVIIGKVIYRSG